MDGPNITKQCNACGEEKALSEYNHLGQSADGYDYRCRECQQARYKDWHKKRPPRDPDLSLLFKYCRDCEQRKPIREFGLASGRPDGYHIICRQCAKARHSQWIKGRGGPGAYNREWRAKNPEKTRAIRENGRARRLSAGGRYTVSDVRRIYAEQDERCYWCKDLLNGNYHVDHVVPLVKGGSNNPGNLCCACPSCNLSKGSKMPWEFSDRLF